MPAPRAGSLAPGAEARPDLACVGARLIGTGATNPARRRPRNGRSMPHDFSIVLLAFMIEGAGLAAAFAAAAALARRSGSAGDGPALWATCGVGLLGYGAFFAFLPGRGFGNAFCAAAAVAVAR